MKTELIGVVQGTEYQNQNGMFKWGCYSLIGEASGGDLTNPPETRCCGEFKIPISKNDLFAERMLSKKLRITIETID